MKSITATTTLFALLALNVSCGDDDVVPPTPTETTFVRFLNILKDADDVVDIYVDGAADALFADVGVAQPARYQQVPVGQRNFAVNIGGSTIELATLSTTLEKDTFYTVFVYGARDGTGTVSLEVRVDDPDGVPAERVRLNIMNFAVGLGTFDLLEVSPTWTSTVVVTGIEFEDRLAQLEVPDRALFTLGLDVYALNSPAGVPDGVFDFYFSLVFPGGTDISLFLINEGEDDQIAPVLISPDPSGYTGSLAGTGKSTPGGGG